MNVIILDMKENNNEYCRRDILAIGRTHLANERTLLSYWRTALAFLILGAYLIRQTSSSGFLVSGIIAILFSATLFIFGTLKFNRFKKTINSKNPIQV